MTKRDKQGKVILPSTLAFIRARHWLMLGCPMFGTNECSAKEAVITLRQLVEAMPEHFPQYCHGTDEYERAVTVRKQEKK